MAALTVKGLQAIKATEAGMRLRDGGNLYGDVRRAKDGRITIMFRWRFRYDGKKHDFTCGTWPGVTLAEIRRIRNEAERVLASGVNPNDHDRNERAARQEAVIREIEQRQAKALAEAAKVTVRQLFEMWAEMDLADRNDSGAETKRGFEKDLLPALGDRYAVDITRADVMGVLDRIKGRGALRLANRVLAEIRQMFGFAVIREIVIFDPTSGIQKKHVGGQDKENDRILSDDQIRALSAALKAAELLESTRHAVWLILATTVRIGEIIKAKKTAINLDAGTWRIPPSVAKNKESHVIFLSPFAREHLRKLMELSDSEVWLMPSRSDPDNHVDPKSITKQIADRQLKFYERVAYKKRSANENALVLGEESWSPHDLRRTSATMMQQLGVLPVVIEACLNHREANRMKRVYQRYDYAAEKREAWRLVGERLDSLCN
ncbi:phage integrase family site specific recombinase [Caballeronia udeis]|uniref:Phage integrase family site specific recombinase n=1 Tax=Caballeronia udeis TaxID=1232866 RepID=A0A158K0Y2_9BURK|nr:site-specific integrase [Caballeronia udeis]SAL74854.1 phage integrase family site specific recombinase [Caballeronia udeis]